jgi:hypothetical protein
MIQPGFQPAWKLKAQKGMSGYFSLSISLGSKPA